MSVNQMKSLHTDDDMEMLRDQVDKSCEPQDDQEVDGPSLPNPLSPPPNPLPDKEPNEALHSQDSFLSTDAPKCPPVGNVLPSDVPETTEETLHENKTTSNESVDLREPTGAMAPAFSHFTIDEVMEKLTSGVGMRLGITTPGPDNDFTAEEVESVLGHMKGWVELSKETEVWTKLGPLRGENGHYLLWFWPRRKRPAIFVTLNKQVKSFIIQKEQAAGCGDQVTYYFVYKDQRREPSMEALVDFHIKHGLVDKRDNGMSALVTFTKAVQS